MKIGYDATMRRLVNAWWLWLPLASSGGFGGCFAGGYIMYGQHFRLSDDARQPAHHNLRHVVKLSRRLKWCVLCCSFWS
jgi:hypothetical protein